MKKIIKSFTPPIFIDLLRFFSSKKNAPEYIQWKGNYADWSSALAASDGYDSELILEKVRAATIKVKTGQAVYERDSFIFEEKQYSWALLAILMRIAAQYANSLNVIDFGGSLGSTYFQNKDFLHAANIQLNWRVVEQPHFVEAGNKDIASDELSFFSSLEAAAENFDANLILLSGVLQCVERPEAIIHACKQLSVSNILIDRTAFIDDTASRITVQYVPEWIYRASYPCRFFNEMAFIESFTDAYTCALGFDSFADIPLIAEDGKRMYWKGFYFIKN
jgi:putative methyltransferase (TIGR04325 family)